MELAGNWVTIWYYLTTENRFQDKKTILGYIRRKQYRLVYQLPSVGVLLVSDAR